MSILDHKPLLFGVGIAVGLVNEVILLGRRKGKSAGYEDTRMQAVK
jgi:hypothetical protein